MKQISVAFIFLIISLVPASAQQAGAANDPAAQQISRFYDALLASMKQGRSIGVQGRYRKLEPVVEQTFDLPDMARLAVGPTWSTISTQDQQALIRAFGRMTIANYAKNFDSFSGEQFVIDPNVQTHGEDKLVNTKLVSGKSTTPFIYRMRQAGGSWKVIDVLLNGYVSELATRRADYATTISTGGAAALTTKVNSVADKLLNGG